MKKVLVTGAAGFIGAQLCRDLTALGYPVTGLDNLNDYYDVSLKRDRLRLLEAEPLFEWHKVDLGDRQGLNTLMADTKPAIVVNLAAQAGVRFSLISPEDFITSNLVGFANLLEACRANPPEHLVFASSSSVYGANTKTPFSPTDPVDHPVSLYGATKKSNELLAHTYAHLFRIPTTGLRFFTVYGPWARPDMAPTLFAKAIMEEQPIQLFNHGNMQRDFTFITDITQGIIRILSQPPEANPEWSGDSPDPSSSSAPYKIYNIGNNQPVQLLRFVELLEDALGKKAEKSLVDLQPGDLVSTVADISSLEKAVGYKPQYSIETGVKEFAQWYLEYYNV